MLGLKSLHSLHFAVKSLSDSRDFYERQLGFVPKYKASAQLAERTGQDSIVYGGGTARVCLSAPRNDTCKAARYLKQHPEGVMSVAFNVDDIQHAFKTLEKNGATLLSEINVMGEYKDFEITTPLGDVQFRFIESKAATFAPGFEAVAETQGGPIPWIGIDHITCNMRTMKPFIDWLKDVMGFEQFWQIEFHTSQLEAGKTKDTGSGLKSIVMWDPRSEFKVASNEPLRPFFRASQIERFVEDNRGAGVQHIAMAVPSAIAAVEQLKHVGLKFLDAPPTYYERLPARFKEVGFDMARVKEPLEQIKKNNLLVDGSADGYLLQIFTDELRQISGQAAGAPAFYEVIQRAGDRGFGYGNFRALFEAIEALQTTR
jgi:4-hydroxyphenylpyruvate dioxygenase